MSQSTSLHQALQTLSDASYETYKDRTQYSFDEIEAVYEMIQESVDTSRTLPPTIQVLAELHIGTENFLNIPLNDSKDAIIQGLTRAFEEIPYDTTIRKEIKSYTRDFQYYPDPRDPDFLDKVHAKQEFGMYHTESEIQTFQDKCGSNRFEMAPHQLFLKNWMAPDTPYKGLLVFHGVGVGKTCTGISMAENFKDHYGDREKRIIILAPPKIQEGWKQTIFTPERGDAQCTGNAYQLTTDDGVLHKDLETATNKTIKTYYELHGYESFTNRLEKVIADGDLRGVPAEESIRSSFSHRMLIIDEAHNIRSDALRHQIQRIVTHSRNMRLVLLTANPMYNQPQEIMWLLNLLRLNDGRLPVPERMLFHDEDDLTLTDEAHETIGEMSRGYVSYLRGENPSSFPYRIHPSECTFKGSLALRASIFKARSGYTDPLSGEIRTMDFLELFNSTLKGYQAQMYREAMASIVDEGAVRFGIEDKHLSQLGDVAFPANTYQEAYGDAGFKQAFQKHASGAYMYRENDAGDWLHKRTIGNFSAKIATILEILERSEGITFIYTNWIGGSLRPLCMALERNGYLNISQKSLFKGTRSKTIGTYLSSDDPKFHEGMAIATSQDNKDGDRIRVILGSTTASEGLDFKCIRSIHVMEPHEHLNKVEQVIGRGVRTCSHKYLDDEKRNVMIYLHNAVLEPTGIDEDEDEGAGVGLSEVLPVGTHDTYLYRYSERKAQQIGLVENILKSHAIDRCLFQQVNQILRKSDVQPIRVTPPLRDTSFRTGSVYPVDRSYSRVCSFQRRCAFPIVCDTIALSDTDTMNLSYSKGYLEIYKKRIATLFRQCLAYTLDEIRDELAYYTSVYESYLLHALQQMIREEYPLVNRPSTSTIPGYRGYLRFTGEMFVFQPRFSHDTQMPYYYRLNPELQPLTKVRITKRTLAKPKICSGYIVHEPDIRRICETVERVFDVSNEHEIDQHLQMFKGYAAFGPRKLLYAYIRLPFEDKIKLYTYLVGVVRTRDLSTIPFSRLEYSTIVMDELVKGMLRRKGSEGDSLEPFAPSMRHSAEGFFVFHPPTKEIVGYSVDIVDEMSTATILPPIAQERLRKRLRHTRVSHGPHIDGTHPWGFGIFVPRKESIVCKIVHPEDPPRSNCKYPQLRTLPGVIASDTNNNSGVWGTNPYGSPSGDGWLLSEYREYVEILPASHSKPEVIQFLKRPRSHKRILAILVELCMWTRGTMLSPEMAWWWFVAKFDT